MTSLIQSDAFCTRCSRWSVPGVVRVRQERVLQIEKWGLKALASTCGLFQSPASFHVLCPGLKPARTDGKILSLQNGVNEKNKLTPCQNFIFVKIIHLEIQIIKVKKSLFDRPVSFKTFERPTYLVIFLAINFLYYISKLRKMPENQFINEIFLCAQHLCFKPRLKVIF